jgi:signal transduction histidine kinase
VSVSGERLSHDRPVITNVLEILEIVEAVNRAATTDEVASAALAGITQLFRPISCAVLWFGDHVMDPSGRGLDGPIDSKTIVQVHEQFSEELLRARQEDTDLLIAPGETAPAALMLRSLLHARTQPIRAIPIAAGETLYGVLLITDDVDPHGAGDNRDLCAYLGRQMAYAVSRLWAHAQLALTEAALEESAKTLRELVAKMDDLGIIVRSIADAVNVAVIFYDTDNHPKLRNHMAEEVLELTGYDPKTGMSTHVYASDRHTPVKRDKDIVSETIEGDQRGVIYWVGAPDRDDQRAVITEAIHIARPSGESLGSAIMTYDVTDLANAIDVREEYLATVSHELRTPLTSIVGYLDLIADAYDLAELGFEQEFQIIQRNVDQVLNLLRDLASAGTREQSLRIEPVDLTALVSQSIGASRPSIDRARQQLELELPSSSLIGRVDAARVAQVLDNVVSNAVKYTPEGGALRVSLTREGDDALILIADTGRGISKNDQARVFERFFRSHEVRDAAIQGVGIGLSIAKTITEAHGGTITIDSEPGKGATFIIRLPLRPQGAPLSSLSDHP